MRRTTRRFPVLAFLVCTLVPLRAALAGDKTVFESPDLRIYRALDRQGREVLVLTNVDDEGGFLPGRRSEADVRGESKGTTASNLVAEGATAVAPSLPENAGPDAARVDGTGGTTIIININNAPPAPAAVAYPVLAVGGLPGPFRYPDHLHFLGYGHGTGSPSLFSGLGLNAGNRFGLKTGTVCENGYDCLFGPLRDHP